MRVLNLLTTVVLLMPGFSAGVPFNNPFTEINKRGTETRHTYDNENRLLSSHKDNLRLIQNQYDSVGNLIFQTDANTHKTAFLYDERNQRITESRP